MTGQGRLLRLAICQATSEVSGDGVDPRPANLARAEDLIREASDQGANLIAFGEVFLNGYRTDEDLYRFSSVIDPPDRDVEALISLSRETGRWIVMGISRRGPSFPGNLFNSSVLVSPEGIVGCYDKVHLANFVLPDGQLATEMIYWSPGERYSVFDTPWCRLGLQICRDVRYPEASRVLTVRGAELIINSTAAPTVERSATWNVEHFSTTRAIENQVWFAMSGVLGQQRNMLMRGNSRLVTPVGEVVLSVPDFEEVVTVVEVDIGAVHSERALTHVLDRRVPTAYTALTDPLSRLPAGADNWRTAPVGDEPNATPAPLQVSAPPIHA